MNHFGHIADDLTSLEMSIDKVLDLPHARTLKAALQRAFVEACKASRAQRLATEAVKPGVKSEKPSRKAAGARERFVREGSKSQLSNPGH